MTDQTPYAILMSLFFVQDHSFLDMNFTLSKGKRLVGMSRTRKQQIRSEFDHFGTIMGCVI